MDANINENAHEFAKEEANCVTNNNEDVADSNSTVLSNSDPTTPTAEAAPMASPFDKSNRKIILHNVYQYWNQKKVEAQYVRPWIQALRDRGVTVQVERIKKPPREHWAALTVTQTEMVPVLCDYINELQARNKKGFVLEAKPAVVGSGVVVVERNGSDERNKKRQANDDDLTHDDGPVAVDGPYNNHPKKRPHRQLAAARPVTVDEIKDKIVPLWRQSPAEQLETKFKRMIKLCALQIVKDVKKRIRHLSQSEGRKKQMSFYPWLRGKRAIEMRDMVAAPTPVRNKCEFNFGYRYLFDDTNDDDNGNDNLAEYPKVPAVGFHVTGWAGGVSLPHGLPNVGDEMCDIVDAVNGFVASSPLAIYDTLQHVGFWRMLTIRSSRRTRECMLVFMHAPPSGGAGAAASTTTAAFEQQSAAGVFAAEKERLVQTLTKLRLQVPNECDNSSKDGKDMLVTSIFFQEYDGLSTPPPEHPVQHVYGKSHLLERLGPCTFQISPGAFFQVNTQGAELLYQLVVDHVQQYVTNSGDATKALLFDVCCGTGTIGLTCLKRRVVDQVVGVDISEPAIADAHVNVQLNGYANSDTACRFVVGRAEHVLSKEIASARAVADGGSDTKFIAVVDPARDGLHADAITTLRAIAHIDRIVYVSCNPTETLVRDAVLLCSPSTKKYPGFPFRVSAATPVDMFPGTNHCEMVMVFDRLTEDELDDRDSPE